MSADNRFLDLEEHVIALPHPNRHGNEGQTYMRPAILTGAISAVLLAFPLAALCALVYRFPIPFSEYESGLAAMPRALLAVVFYGILGGFPLLLALGAIGGAAAYKLAGPVSQPVRRLTLAISAAIALVAVILLAILDKIIGPW